MDRGELDKIFDRILAMTNTGDRNSDIHKKDEYYYKKGKKSFLGELFDFN